MKPLLNGLVRTVEEGSMSEDIKNGVLAMAQISGMMARDAQSVANLQLDLARSLILDAVKWGFNDGVRKGRQFQQFDSQVLMGLRPTSASPYEYEDHRDNAVTNFCAKNELYKTMFPNDTPPDPEHEVGSGPA